MQQYPAYKDSSLAWLGNIPAHWKEERAKWVFREIDERSETGDEELLSVSHLTGVTPRSEKNVTMFMAASYEGSKLCRKDDLVINIMWAWMGALGVAPCDGIVSPAYGVYRRREPDAYHPRYLDYLLRTEGYVAEYTRRSKGIHSSRWRMYTDSFFTVPILTPPPDEQAAMADYLDAKCAEIDRFIAAKRRLIALLREQRAGVINRAVTKGLDPDAPTKPSGLDWLGEIPAHWEMLPLKQVAGVKLSGVDKHSHADETPVQLCNYMDVYHNDFICPGHDFMQATATPNEIAAFTLRGGDVIITKDSESWEDIAVPAYVTADLEGVLCGYHLALLRPDPAKLHGEFLFRALSASAIAHQFNIAATGITRYGLSKHTIRSASIPVPPPLEQDAIVDFLTTETKKIDAAIARAEREIELIREYRTALIAEVVTGQVDVRQAVVAT